MKIKSSDGDSDVFEVDYKFVKKKWETLKSMTRLDADAEEEQE